MLPHAQFFALINVQIWNINFVLKPVFPSFSFSLLQDIMSQYPAEITWKFVRAHVTNGNEEANKLADEAARRCDHDELFEMLELQAWASKILMENLHRGLSGSERDEIVDGMVDINDKINRKLQKDYNDHANAF